MRRVWDTLGLAICRGLETGDEVRIVSRLAEQEKQQRLLDFALENVRSQFFSCPFLSMLDLGEFEDLSG